MISIKNTCAAGTLLLALSAHAQATRDDIEAALQQATLASMFAVKADMCHWNNGGIALRELRLYAAGIALGSSDAGKKLNRQQTAAIAERVSQPAALGVQRSLLEKQVANGACADTSSPTNEKVWLQTVEMVKTLMKQPAPAPATDGK